MREAEGGMSSTSTVYVDFFFHPVKPAQDLVGVRSHLLQRMDEGMMVDFQLCLKLMPLAGTLKGRYCWTEELT